MATDSHMPPPSPGVKLDAESVCAEYGGFVLHMMVHLLGARQDAEDLTHEVLMIAMRRIKAGEEVFNPKAWLQGIVVRVVSNARKTRWFRGLFGTSCFHDPMIDWNSPEIIYDGHEESQNLYKMLDRLTEKKRTVFILHELLEMTAPEIAVSVGCPVNTVYARLRHARAELLEMRKRASAREMEPETGQASVARAARKNLSGDGTS